MYLSVLFNQGTEVCISSLHSEMILAAKFLNPILGSSKSGRFAEEKFGRYFCLWVPGRGCSDSVYFFISQLCAVFMFPHILLEGFICCSYIT